MYSNAPVSEIAGDFKLHVEGARAAHDHGNYGASRYLVEASVATLEQLVGRMNEMPVRLAFDELPPLVQERIIWVQAGGDIDKARVWYNSPEPIFHGRVPAEAFASKRVQGTYLNDTCNYRVQEHLDAYKAAKGGRRLELNIPASADWSREQHEMDRAQRKHFIDIES